MKNGWMVEYDGGWKMKEEGSRSHRSGRWMDGCIEAKFWKLMVDLK